jgi:hypothetical protein
MLLMARGPVGVKLMPFLRLSAVLIFSSQILSPSWAQNGDTARLPYPKGSQITFQWDYSCLDSRRCSFDCPERRGASHVTKLSILLGTIPLGGKDTPAILYDFATTEIPRGSGFTLMFGLSTLSCQVNGMTLDYSGPAKAPASDTDLIAGTAK